jgi:hypothetical protein
MRRARRAKIKPLFRKEQNFNPPKTKPHNIFEVNNGSNVNEEKNRLEDFP